MNIGDFADKQVAALGLGVVVMVIVEVLKHIKIKGNYIVGDGQAGTVATAINIVILAIVGLLTDVVGVDLEGDQSQAVLSVLIIGSQFFFAILGGFGGQKMMRTSNVKGFRPIEERCTRDCE